MEDKNSIAVSDLLNWKVVDTKGRALLYRKHIPETLIFTNDGTKILKAYNEALEHFKTLVRHRIKKTSTGELSLAYSNNTIWYHRDEERLILNLFEHTLKRLCLDDGMSVDKSIAKIHVMKEDGIFYSKE